MKKNTPLRISCENCQNFKPIFNVRPWPYLVSVVFEVQCSTCKFMWRYYPFTTPAPYKPDKKC